MKRELERIAAKLEQLRAADPECRFFGAHAHRYRLGSRLSLRQIESIEKRYAIRLPDDFRAFLASIGNGGAGPGYGLQRFGFAQSVAEMPTARPKGPFRQIQKTQHGTLSRQDLFDASGKKVDPFDVSFYDTIRALAPDGKLSSDVPSQVFPLAAPFREWEDDSELAWSDIDPWVGTWRLADYGCAMAAHLVLHGRYRGQVWFYDPNACSFTPFGEMANVHYVEEDRRDEDVGALFRFGSWYEHWLDHALRHVRSEYEDAT